MEEIHTTRSELLKRKTQIELAEQGRDLLKGKRDALLVEFMGIMDVAIQASEKLQKVASEAGYTLAIAKAVDGVVTLKSAAFATRGEVIIDIKGSYIMGVPVPEVEKKTISRSALTRGYSVTGVSSRIDETAERFEEELNMIIEVAAVETKLKRLGSEIQKTRRRVNALDYLVIPTLKDQVKFIQTALDERAREDLFRLKKVKKALEVKKKAQAEAAQRGKTTNI
ncbi:MAG: V-type ATP synthase subunit D [Actinomycetia bacterium]|nr:V-type ATP synthase subunit D [Actinomycetes bacterium]